MNIGLFYGTETGNAEMLSEDIEAELGVDVDCDLRSLGDVSPDEFNKDTFYIFVTSTYGSGELPTKAQEFYDNLKAARPNLKGIRFALFGLGDMVFEHTFNQGPENLGKLLIELGAVMVGERGIHDASSIHMPEDIALPWLEGIMSEIMAEAA